MPQKLITVTAAGTPQALFSKMTNASYVLFKAGKSLDALNPVQNTGVVAIGHSAAVHEQTLDFQIGDERNYIAPAGMRFDLSRWYIDAANSGDGLVVVYE